MAYTLDQVGSYRAQWGEGPIWHNDRLLYVDIEGHQVASFDPAADEEKLFDVGERVGTVVPRASGGLVIAGDSGFSFLDIESGAHSPIADPEANIPDNRFNDGKCDPAGRFWAGTISLIKEPGTAKLYCMEADHSVSEKYGSVTNSNGICWSPDASVMYYIDTPTKRVLKFDYDLDSGAIQNPEIAVETTPWEGSPDGMTIDAEGNLWVAFCRGSAVVKFDPKTGNELDRVDVPCTGVTAPALGGPNLNHLYITTGQFGNLDEPAAGYTYVTEVATPGLPASPFAG